jgi:predicted transcriptional regulator of viral defense system
MADKFVSPRGPSPQIEKDEFIEHVERTIASKDRSFVTAPEVAEGLEVERRTVGQYLKDAAESGRIERAKIGGSSVIYWFSESDSQ